MRPYLYPYQRRNSVPPAVRAAAASDTSPYRITSLDFANQQYWRQGVRSSLAAIPGYSFARVGARAVTAADGSVNVFESGVPRIVPGDGLKVSAGAVNKCLTPPEAAALVTPATDSPALEAAMGVASCFESDTGALFGVVDASALIEAGGLSQIAPNGRAWVVDNTAGSGPALINFSGPVGNVNDHNFSAWAWQDSGAAGDVRIGQNSAGASLGIVTSDTPDRVDVTQTPGDSTRLLQLYVNAGARGYLIAPQLTETSGVVDYIPGIAGSSATVGPDVFRLTDLDALGLTSAVLAAGFTVVAKVRATAAVAAKPLFSISDGTTSNRVLLYLNTLRPTALISSGGATQAGLGRADATAGDVVTLAISVQLNQMVFAASTEGATVADTSASMPVSISQMELGRFSPTSLILNSDLASVSVIPQPTSASNLLNLVAL